MTSKPILYFFLLFIFVYSASFAVADEMPQSHVYRKISGILPELTSLDVYANGRSKGAPVVIFVHGGGWVTGDKAKLQGVPAVLDFFRKRNMVVVSVNMRLVHNPKSPSTTFREQTADIASAIHWVHDNIRRYNGDPDRLFLLGYSAGAHLVALVGTDKTYLAKENLDLSVLSGVISLDVSAYDIPRAIREAPSQGVPVSPAALTRVFSADRQTQEAASPVYFVKKTGQYPPFLIVYVGIFDTSSQGVFKQTLTQVQSKAFAKLLRDAGTYAEVYGEPNKTHRGIMRAFGSADEGLTQTLAKFLQRFSQENFRASEDD